MPAVHAPHNMVVAGKQYRGGEFIPGEAQDQASPEERKALGLPDMTHDAGLTDRQMGHAKATLGDKYDSTKYTSAILHYFQQQGARLADSHRKALELLAGERDDGPVQQPVVEDMEGRHARELEELDDRHSREDEEEEARHDRESEEDDDAWLRHGPEAKESIARQAAEREALLAKHQEELDSRPVDAEEDEPEAEEEEEEEDEPEEDESSPTKDFADGYSDSFDTAQERITHFFESLGDLDPDDEAFTGDVQDAIASDYADDFDRDLDESAGIAFNVFDDHGFDPADPRVGAVMKGLALAPDAPFVPFDPTDDDTFAMLDLNGIDDPDKREAARQLLRVFGHSAAAGDVALVPMNQGGKPSVWANYFEGGHFFDMGSLNHDDKTALSADEEQTHANLFDGLETRPLIGERSVPKSAGNFGRVSAGENVEIEADWDVDHHDVYKPVGKGWYLMRRGTTNPDVGTGGDNDVYRFVRRSEVAKAGTQLVGLPPQYWAKMSTGVTQGDADGDGVERVEAKQAKAKDVDELKRKRELQSQAKKIDRDIGQTRDLANQVAGLNKRSRALETSADEIVALKDDDEAFQPPHSQASKEEEDRLQDEYLDAKRRHGITTFVPDPRVQKERDAFSAHTLEPDDNHPSFPHYAALRDAIDELASDSTDWRNIEDGFDGDGEGFEDAAPVRRRDSDNSAASPERSRNATNANLDSDIDSAISDDDVKRSTLAEASDAYATHFETMGDHLKRVKEAAEAVMPHVADDEDRMTALQRVRTLADRHLRRLKRSGHYGGAPVEMAWPAYFAWRVRVMDSRRRTELSHGPRRTGVR